MKLGRFEGETAAGGHRRVQTRLGTMLLCSLPSGLPGRARLRAVVVRCAYALVGAVRCWEASGRLEVGINWRSSSFDFSDVRLRDELQCLRERCTVMRYLEAFDLG